MTFAMRDSSTVLRFAWNDNGLEDAFRHSCIIRHLSFII